MVYIIIDIYVKDIGLLIEYDGEYWHRNKKEKDKTKDKIAKKENQQSEEEFSSILDNSFNEEGDK